MAKRFKTVAGYLRSKSDDLYAAQARAEAQGRTPISDDEGRRQILNHLLAHLGVAGIQIDEDPVDAIRRAIRATLPESKQLRKDLETCLKWLEAPTPRISFVGAHAD